MKILRSFPLLAFTLSLTGIVGYCIAAGSIGLLVIAGVLAVMSWYVTEGPRGRTLPKWVSNILLVAVLINFFVDYFQHMGPEEVMGVLGRFSVWLILIKLYERKEPRDYAHALLLSLLLMLTACFLSTDVVFGVVLLFYAVLGLYVLVLFQLHSAFEQAKKDRRRQAPRDYRFVPSVRPILGAYVGLHFRALIGSIGVSGVLLSGVLFVVFPRSLGEGLVPAVRGPAGGRRGGLSDQFNVMTGGRISASRRLVGTVKLRDAGGAVVRLDEPLLLRANVFEEYRGHGEWKPRDREGNQDLALAGQFESLASSGTPLPDDLYTLDVEMLVPSDQMMAPYVPVEITSNDVLPFSHVRRTALLRSSDGSRVPRYSLRVDLSADDELLRALQTDVVRSRRRSSGGPAGPGRPLDGAIQSQLLATKERVKEILGTPFGPSPGSENYYRWSHESAVKLVEFLHGDDFTYTLDLSDVVQRVGVDPIEQFLLDTHRGHCEYFASALALMCQLMGIEARVVNGYMAHQWDDEKRVYNILEANAHAWVEVRTGDFRWETFDPTPPSVLNNQMTAEETLADRIGWIFDRFESGWENNVTSFDSDSQGRLGRSFDLRWSEALTNTFSTARAWMASVNRSFRLGKAGYIWMGIVAFAILLAVIALLTRVRRWRRMKRLLHLEYLKGPEYQRLLRQLGFYLDMLTVLHKGGCTKPRWQPPLSFAHALTDQRPQEGAIVRQLTDVFYRARYGRQTLTREETTHAAEQVQRLASLLRVRRA